MGDIKGFLKVERKTMQNRPVCERIKDFCAVMMLADSRHSQEQASRCMDCGTPFCHWGCPIGNYIPEWNDLLFKGRWADAFRLLQAMNNFPEVTARVCPAPCEYACVLGINDSPVTIRENELAIIEQAFEQGLVKPNPPKKRTGKKIAVVGSGPAGLAAADQLNKVGHKVTVFEKDERIGGILRYGIPDFKLEKWVLDRRFSILEKEGIEFRESTHVGIDLPVSKLKNEFDIVCLACGSREPRDLAIEGRSLSGIHFAMDYLIQTNERVAGKVFPQEALIDAKGKKVVVIGGGDTGADCVGVAHRQGAACVVQIEILPKPADCRTPDFPWPTYPMILKTSTSHEEGGIREWSVLTKGFLGENGRVKKLSCVRVEFKKDSAGCMRMQEIPGTEFQIEADLVILALGFLHPVHRGLIEELKIELDERGNVRTGKDFMTSLNAVFSCGDMRRGQSQVAWAIADGRSVAHYIDRYLIGRSRLPII
ncbi:MAG: glutamate synthase subunit beta [Candidatus Omnitrophica bacterium]|nr:glutamate synthase subunit beta [Candidatus Omnitrophota bacterium]